MGQHYDDRRRMDTHTDFRFDANYLKDGYFAPPDYKNLKREVVDTLALQVAKALTNTKIKPTQLRRFFSQVRAIERSLDSSKSFGSAASDLAALKSFAAYQVGRGLVLEDFKRFIDRNVDLAVQNEDNFRRGFIPHFAAVLGFFVYLKPEH